ncbi:MAG: GNAT family N-acetyltransferase [Chitinophagaceae bacterium]|jgi:predicted GNAT family N-acyltransferase|nr:MAG: GNAT family N-acetyltransferase [Chitinophagaceae bacterium]
MYQIRLLEYGGGEYRDMVKLRDKVLRKPLGLHFTEKYLQQEVNDILIGCFETEEENQVIIGCCVLSLIDDELVQLRQMAVREDFQRSGIGREILTFAETEALKEGFTMMMMHARKAAVPFYERLGYQSIGEEFLEVGIPHYEMRKKLK